jgi:hypothetical protein
MAVCKVVHPSNPWVLRSMVISLHRALMGIGKKRVKPKSKKRTMRKASSQGPLRKRR